MYVFPKSLLQKPLGIIALLDEACMFPKSTKETFATKLFQNFRSNARFKKPKLSSTDFTISHYAGDVTYQTDLFLEQNRDYVVVEHQALLLSSESPFVSGLFPSLPEENSKSSYKFSSVATRFKQQLQSLMETLSATEPHYIRCVKPNNDNKPGRFENLSVLHQLRCGGVMEVVRISCAGYPTRRTYDEFLDRFGMLAPDLLEGNYDERLTTEKLLTKMNLSNFQLGSTKVFLRAGQMAQLDAKRVKVLNSAAKTIQRKVRTYIARKQFIAMRKAAMVIQAHWRGRLGRMLFEFKRRDAAAITIQKIVKMWILRNWYKSIRAATTIIQACVCAFMLRRERKRKERTTAAINIQATWRGRKSLVHYKQLKKAVIAFQCAWRVRGTGILQEAKSKLEKRCEELTWRLQLEKRLRMDVEESKAQEHGKVQATVVELQQQIEILEANLLKEQENSKTLSNQLANFVKVRPTLEASSQKPEAYEGE